MKDRDLFKRLLLGLGFDCEDGIWRITRGENFHLFGGSDETHEEMQEKAMKMNEELAKREKTLDTVSQAEFMEIADKLKMFKKRCGD
jgi:hypothetical protein